jgi:glycosyltransferase involved in cell wall biosynthesis
MLPPGRRRVSSSGARAAPGDITVTTLVMTYNHARLIEQAVESALAQELEGGYEILIADDCSTDGTREIVRAYSDRYPEVIRPLLSEQNIGENAVRARGTRAARGAYVALLDGDDYWTSPHKLRKQVEFLDPRPEYAICFHNATVVYDDGSSEPHPFHSKNPTQRLSCRVPPETSTLEDVAVGNFMQTSSVMFRNGLFNQFPNWYFEARLPDWSFHVLNAEHGRIGYIDEILSAYRVHGGGAWSDRISHLRDPKDLADIIWIHDAINQHLGFRYDARIRQRTAYLASLAATLLADEGRLEEAAAHARRSLSDAPNLTRVRGRMRLEVLARPRLARARSSAPVAVAAISARELLARARRAAVRARRAAARLFG